MMKIGTVYFDRSGSSGNIYAVMGGASAILRRLDKRDKADEMVKRVTSSGSYDEALGIIGEYVNLVEVGGDDDEYDDE